MSPWLIQYSEAETKNTWKGIHALVKLQMAGKEELRLLYKFFRCRATTL